MPLDANNSKPTDAIRRRSEELAASGGRHTSDAELLAAIADGTVLFDQVDEDALRRHIDAFGSDAVVDAFLSTGSESTAAETLKRQFKKTSSEGGVTEKSNLEFPRRLAVVWRSWNNPLAWAAAAAVILFVGVVVIRTSKTTISERATVDSTAALMWAGQPQFDQSASKAWGLSSTPLPNQMPDFHQGPSTLGSSGADRFTTWRLATVILKSRNGWGSGAFVSADGWILSTYDVVALSAQEAAITGLPVSLDVITAGAVDGRLIPKPPLKARLFRADPVRNLALLKLDGPSGGRSLPYFHIAQGFQKNEECFVIGSQTPGPTDGGRAWLVRSGNVLREFHFPELLEQTVNDAMLTDALLSRARFKLIVTDTITSPGDMGGPLLNSKGELIGLTFMSPANSRAFSRSWHIALSDLQSFLFNFPAQPEAVPFDPWTAGLPNSTILEPQLSHLDDGRIDALRYVYANRTQSGILQSTAFTTFVDLKERAALGKGQLNLIPYGLWGTENGGQFRFNLFITLRADHLTALGYANNEGTVDEIRLGSNPQGATIIWRLNGNGTWISSRPSGSTPLIDPSRISEADWNRIQLILKGTFNDAQSQSSGNQPRAGHA